MEKIEQIEYGTELIEFTLRYSLRRTLSIHVHPDASVEVVAPAKTPLRTIKNKVRRRAAWILEQQQQFRRIEPVPQPKEYVGGETHLYLGRQYRLKIMEGIPTHVELKGRFFEITLPDKSDTQKAKALLDNWYRQHALAKLQERLDFFYDLLTREDIPYPILELRRMPKRWGSCTPEGKILLHPDLIQKPIYCIDYVILHELCHLKEHHHGKEFYALLSKYMGDWEWRKERLEEGEICPLPFVIAYSQKQHL